MASEAHPSKNDWLTVEQAAVLSGVPVGLVIYWATSYLDAAVSGEGRRWLRPEDVHILRTLMVAEASNELFERHSDLVTGMRVLDLPASFAGWLLITDELDLYPCPDPAVVALEAQTSTCLAFAWLGEIPTSPLPSLETESLQRAPSTLKRLPAHRHDVARVLLAPIAMSGVSDESDGMKAAPGLAHLLVTEPAWNALSNDDLTRIAGLILDLRK